MVDIDAIYEALLKAESDEREDEAMDFRVIVTKHEQGFALAMENIFQKQKDEVKQKLNSIKSIEDLFMFDTTSWKVTTRIMAEKRCKNAMNENGIRVYQDLSKMGDSAKFVVISPTFDMEYPEAIEYIEEQGIKLANDVTEETESLIANIIATAFTEGLTVAETARLIDEAFDNAIRAKMIARTEIVRAANYGTLSAYKQSGVVEGKEWLTAQDEKVCPYCNSLDRKQLGLDESFLPVGESLEVITAEGKPISMTNNYLDTQAPPVHPRCRCTLLPITKTIALAPKPSQEFFDDPAHNDYYNEKKQEHLKWINENLTADGKIDPVALKDFYKTNYPKGLVAMEEWQVDTNRIQPMAFRYQSVKLEGKKGDLDKLIWMDESMKEKVEQSYDDLMPRDEYISMRAFNQAYMEAKKIDKVQLYRGTDGDAGEEIVAKLEEFVDKNTEKFSVNDRLVAGYSTSLKIANRWGKMTGGITVRLEYDAKDIILHTDLLTGVTGKYRDEIEYICKSGLRDIKSEDITFMIPSKGYTDKPFGETF